MIWYSNMWAESLKMYLRAFYIIAVWYEIIIQADLGHYEEGYDQSESEWKENYLKRKLPLIIMYSIMSIWNFVEKCVFGGTRLVVMFGGFWVVIHFTLGMVPIYWPYWPIVNNSILFVFSISWYRRWMKFGENDMGSFVHHGPFRPGFKRFTAAEHGNACMLFYPVNKSATPKPFSPYRDLAAYM